MPIATYRRQGTAAFFFRSMARLLLLAVFLSSVAYADESELFKFTSPNGQNPIGGVIQARDGNFYGTTSAGGKYGYGTVFKMTSTGVLATLYIFDGGPHGGYPNAELVQGADGNLYGTTLGGGDSSLSGTIFRITPAGVLTTLHTFNVSTPDSGCPTAGLILASDGNFYGAVSGGSCHNIADTPTGGAIFKMTPSGVLTTIYRFGVNGYLDGLDPYSGLTEGPDGYLYGTTIYGGTAMDQGLRACGNSGCGTVYKISKSGDLTTLYSFTDMTTGGTHPKAGLTVGPDGSLYGITANYLVKGTTGISMFKIDMLGRYSKVVDLPLGYGKMQGKLLLAADGNFYGTSADDPGSSAILQISPLGVFKTLYTFDGTTGFLPKGTLFQANDGNIYGTASAEGKSGNGSVFRINYAGRLTVLNTFDNLLGAYPAAALVQTTDGNFYGTTYAGGKFNGGTVFKISPTGSLTTLYHFDGLHGGLPRAALVLGSDGNLYGTTEAGGAYGYGVVFSITPAGVLSLLYSFDGATGADPRAALLKASDGKFYGTTASGGSSGYGTIFSISKSGSFSSLYSFSKNDGAYPLSALIQARDGNFYGTTSQGGGNACGGPDITCGTVFQFTPAGALTVLHRFECCDALPEASLLQGSDGAFYGTTYGAITAYGSIFKLTSSGEFTTLHEFDPTHDSANPLAGLIQAGDGNFYGTGYGGGSANGDVYQMTPDGQVREVHGFAEVDGFGVVSGVIQGADGAFYGTTVTGHIALDGTDFGRIYRLTIEPKLRLSATSVDFGSQPQGKTGFNSVTVSNTGTATLNISDVTLSGATEFFLGNKCVGALAPAAQCEIDLRFLPTSTGARTGTLTITSNAASSPNTVALSGTGTSAAVLSISPSSLDFGNQVVGSTSASKRVTLTNSGSSSFTVYSSYTTGYFNRTSNCPSTLTAGSSCYFDVTFIPNDEGAQTGGLTINCSMSDCPVTVNLSGVGTAAPAAISISPASLDFGNQVVGSASASKRVTLTNTGGGSLATNSYSVTGYFNQSNNCPAALTAGASCSFDVTFVPNMAGAQTGTLTVNCGASNCPAMVNLSGVGVAVASGTLSVSPSSLSFGTWPKGTVSSIQTITLSNVGDAPFNIGDIAFAGDYSGVNHCGSSLAAGSSCDVDVRFAPDGVGDRSGTLTVSCNASGCPGVVSLAGKGGSPAAGVLSISPMSLSFGNQVLSTSSSSQTITLMNTGNAPLGITGLMIAGDFQFSSGCGTSLAAGASCFVTVQFKPTGAGNRSGAITFSCDATGCPDVVTLNGIGVAASGQGKSGGGSLGGDILFLALVAMFGRRMRSQGT